MKKYINISVGKNIKGNLEDGPLPKSIILAGLKIPKIVC